MCTASSAAKRSRVGEAASGWLRAGGLVLLAGLALGAAPAAQAQDRADELEALRDRIEGARENVTRHEADERALLEQLEDVDRRLMEATRGRDAARRELETARQRVAALGDDLDQAQASLATTQKALAARAVALYRGGELGPVRVLFSSASLPEMLSRASALRVLVRHDAELVERFGAERDRLAAIEAEERDALDVARAADRKLGGLAEQLAAERAGKGVILKRVREDRTSERRLLLELEQAAQALEETIRTLGRRSARDDVGSGFEALRGKLPPPVSARVVERFGKVVDPEYGTTTVRNGIDFGAKAGETVRSVGRGAVRFAGWFRGYGRIVIVDHGEGFHSISGHLDEIHVKVGTPVDPGDSLGTVGETGSLGGPSLYFELRQDGKPLDPVPWLVDARG